MRSPKAANRCLPWAVTSSSTATVDQGGVDEPALRTGHVDHPAAELGALGPRQAVQRVALRHYTPAALPMRAAVGRRGEAATCFGGDGVGVAEPRVERRGDVDTVAAAVSPSAHDGGA